MLNDPISLFTKKWLLEQILSKHVMITSCGEKKRFSPKMSIAFFTYIFKQIHIDIALNGYEMNTSDSTKINQTKTTSAN